MNHYFFSLLFFCVALNISAQLKPAQSGTFTVNNQTAIFSNPSNISDGLDIVYRNPNVPSGRDVVWIYSSQTQPNYFGLLTVQSVDGANFTVRGSGYVGIFNDNPSCALEIGKSGENQQLKVNGNILISSDERIKKNIKNIDKSLGKLLLLNPVSYNLHNDTQVLSKQVNSLKTNYVIVGSDSILKPTKIYKELKQNQNRSYYGFLAQDVQKNFPELVYKDSLGMLAVDYIGLIPLVVNSMNEQNILISKQSIEISDLKLRIEKLEKLFYSNKQQK